MTARVLVAVVLAAALAAAALPAVEHATADRALASATAAADRLCDAAAALAARAEPAPGDLASTRRISVHVPTPAALRVPRDGRAVRAHVGDTVRIACHAPVPFDGPLTVAGRTVVTLSSVACPSGTVRVRVTNVQIGDRDDDGPCAASEPSSKPIPPRAAAPSRSNGTRWSLPPRTARALPP